ncbi:MAG: DUF3237 family protein, partial [Actinomyces sp.]
MPELELLMSVDATLRFVPVGATPAGNRVDVPFEGTATSPRWEGELAVSGVDYALIRGDGTVALDIRARVGEGERVIWYSATGRSGPDGIREVFTFETACEEFADLNAAVAVALGTQ